MNRHSQSSKFFQFDRLFGQAGFVAFVTLACLLFSTSAVLAHHPTGGKVPANFLDGFLSGLAHPVIGLDHFAFIVSVGLLAAISRQGIKLPISFLLAALAGAGLHLMQVALPAPELFISGSVLLFGIFLALKDRPNSWVLTGLAAICGLFHGYAYGESIFGAQMSPLIAYLMGFSVIQLVVAIVVYRIGKTVLKKANEQPSLFLRFAGFVICGVGGAFLSTLIVETIFPT